MYHKLIYIFIISFLLFSCSKKEVVVTTPSNNEEKSLEVYNEATIALEEGQYYYASSKFLEAENILPTVEGSAKASLMSSYCLYLINFYS